MQEEREKRILAFIAGMALGAVAGVIVFSLWFL